jgi:hypothetical protein
VGIKAVKNLETLGTGVYLQCTIVAKYWKQEIATEVVEVPQKMETTSESIGLCKIGRRKPEYEQNLVLSSFNQV